MPQVNVREPRAADRDWIRGIYRDYLFDLAPAATGLFPMLPEIGQREPEQVDRLFTDSQARLLMVCYASEPVGFARISMRGQSPGEFSMADFFIARAGRAADPGPFRGRLAHQRVFTQRACRAVLADRCRRLHRRQVSGAHAQRRGATALRFRSTAAPLTAARRDPRVAAVRRAACASSSGRR